MPSPRTHLLAMAASLLLLSVGIAKDPRLDSLGDPLPPYAVARLGTVRLRHGQPVSSLIFSPDGKSLLSVGWGETSLSNVRLWDAAHGEQKWSVNQHFASCAAFAPDGRTIAVGSGVGVVHLWQAETGQELRRWTGDQGAVTAVAFTPDGKRLFTAGGSGKVHLWDAFNGKEIRTFEGHGREVLGIALSADRRTLASTGADGTLRVWKVETGQELLKIVLVHPKGPVAFSPDGTTLFAAGSDGKVRRWTTSGKELPPVEGGSKPVQRLVLSGDGHTLATGADGSIQIWDVKTEKVIARIARAGDVTALALSADGKTVAAAGANGALHIWDVATSKERFAAQGHTEAVTAVAFSQQGRTAVTESEDGTVRLWDAATGREARRGDKVEAPKYPFLDNSTKKLVCIAIAPDGRTLASASVGDAVRLWEMPKGRVLNRYPKFINATALALGPKGRWLAIGRADGLVFLLEAASGKTIRVLSGHSGAASALAFSRDGRLLASGGADHLLRVWETATGMELLTLAGHSGAVRAAAFSPNGRKLLSGGADGVGLIWDLTRGPNGAVPKQPLTAADLEMRWADLLSEDGPTVNGALWVLAMAPNQSVPFIHEQMRPLFGGDAQRAAKLIVELDDDSFDVREHASAVLAAMGPTIAPLLKHALAATQSAEARHRLTELLSKLKEKIAWERERLRIFRALTALEESGSPTARKLLEATAKGAVEPELKQAAREALEHLSASSKP